MWSFVYIGPNTAPFITDRLDDDENPGINSREFLFEYINGIDVINVLSKSDFTIGLDGISMRFVKYPLHVI